MDIEISTKFLDAQSIAEFEKVEDKVHQCYLKALRDSPINFSESEYLPKVFVVPFVRKLILRDREIYVFNEVLQDPYNKRRYAIFPSLAFLEIAEPKFVTANLAHELCHIIDYMKCPERVKTLMEKHKGNVGMLNQELEQTISETYYPHFKEPVRTWLSELDDKANKNRILDKITKSNVEIRAFRDIFEFSKYLGLSESKK